MEFVYTIFPSSVQVASVRSVSSQAALISSCVGSAFVSVLVSVLVSVFGCSFVSEEAAWLSAGGSAFVSVCAVLLLDDLLPAGVKSCGIQPSALSWSTYPRQYPSFKIFSITGVEK